MTPAGAPNIYRNVCTGAQNTWGEHTQHTTHPTLSQDHLQPLPINSACAGCSQGGLWVGHARRVCNNSTGSHHTCTSRVCTLQQYGTKLATGSVRGSWFYVGYYWVSCWWSSDCCQWIARLPCLQGLESKYLVDGSTVGGVRYHKPYSEFQSSTFPRRCRNQRIRFRAALTEPVQRCPVRRLTGFAAE